MQSGADGDRAVRIYGAVPLFHVLNFPLFVHDNRGSLRPLILAALDVIGLQDLIGRENLLVHVTEEWKRNTDLFCESGVGGGTVDADSEDDGIACC